MNNDVAGSTFGIAGDYFDLPYANFSGLSFLEVDLFQDKRPDIVTEAIGLETPLSIQYTTHESECINDEIDRITVLNKWCYNAEPIVRGDGMSFAKYLFLEALRDHDRMSLQKEGEKNDKTFLR